MMYEQASARNTLKPAASCAGTCCAAISTALTGAGKVDEVVRWWICKHSIKVLYVTAACRSYNNSTKK